MKPEDTFEGYKKQVLQPESPGEVTQWISYFTQPIGTGLASFTGVIVTTIQFDVARKIKRIRGAARAVDVGLLNVPVPYFGLQINRGISIDFCTRPVKSELIQPGSFARTPLILGSSQQFIDYDCSNSPIQVYPGDVYGIDWLLQTAAAFPATSQAFIDVHLLII